MGFEGRWDRVWIGAAYWPKKQFPLSYSSMCNVSLGVCMSTKTHIKATNPVLKRLCVYVRSRKRRVAAVSCL